MLILSEASVQAIRKFMQRYPNSRSAILPALHAAQNEVGWINREAMEDVATVLEMSVDQVEEVASFYSMYYTEPVGKYVLEVCKTVPCSMLGADAIIGHISATLGIQPGETTPDGMFTLFRVECLAACHRAPVMQVNHHYFQNLSQDRIADLIQQARSGALQSASAPGFSIRPTWSETVEIEI